MNTETVPGARARARKRDNAERLGKLQAGLNVWLNTTAGQMTLLALVAGMLLVAAAIGR